MPNFFDDSCVFKFNVAMHTQLFLLKQFVNEIFRHDLARLSSSLAFTLSLTLAPFIGILFVFTGLLSQELATKIVYVIYDQMGNEAGSLMQTFIENTAVQTERGLWTLLLYVFVVLISCSAIFAEFRFSLDRINDTEPKTNGTFFDFIKERLMFTGLILGFIILLAFSLLSQSIIEAIYRTQTQLLINYLQWFTNLILFATIFTMLFKYIPTQSYPWKRCFISGFIATLFFLIGKGGIALYLSLTDASSAYGVAGAFIIILVWLYYSSLTVLLSYEFTTSYIYEDIELKPAAENSSRSRLTQKFNSQHP